MGGSMPVFPVPHYIPEFAQMQIHWIDDGIKASGPLPSPSPLVLKFSQKQGLSNELGPSIRWSNIGASASASVLPMNIQNWFPLGWTGWIALLSKGLSRVFSNTTAQKHQFFGAQLSLWSGYHLWKQRHEQWKIDHRIKDPTSRWNPHLSPGWPQSVPLPPLQSIIPSYLLPEPQFHSLQGLTFQNSTPGVTSSLPASTLCLQIV